MTQHLARHVLERLLIDDPRDPAPEAARAHLAVCSQCAERMRSMEGARSAFVTTRPADRFAAAVTARARKQAPARSLRRAALWSGTALAAAALLAVALVPLQPPEPGTIRYKGHMLELKAYVRHGTHTRALRNGDTLAAGDQVAFTYSLDQPHYMLLLGIDDAGTIQRYFPEPALAPSALLVAGVARRLPVGIELDSRRGRERLVALFSSGKIDEAGAREALAAALRAARANGGGVETIGELAFPARQTSVWFAKP